MWNILEWRPNSSVFGSLPTTADGWWRWVPFQQAGHDNSLSNTCPSNVDWSLAIPMGKSWHVHDTMCIHHLRSELGKHLQVPKTMQVPNLPCPLPEPMKPIFKTCTAGLSCRYVFSYNNVHSWNMELPVHRQNCYPSRSHPRRSKTPKPSDDHRDPNVPNQSAQPVAAPGPIIAQKLNPWHGPQHRPQHRPQHNKHIKPCHVMPCK